ncbi:chromosome segregation protein SMC [Candidatus Magnetomorum sp. HK-1]|nr:chromosome segregation protein SMC [Candidatus Magnetomorum sp. HK-1]
MYISQISLKNWKNFKRIETSLNQRMFIVGPNASGKSNFIDVFRFIYDIVKPGGGLKSAIQSRSGFSNVCCLASNKNEDIEIEITLTGDSISWNYSIGINKQEYLSYERVLKNGKLIIDRPDEDDSSDQILLTQTFLEQVVANKTFREIADFFQAVSYFHLVPQLVRNPDFSSEKDYLNDAYGKNFTSRLSSTDDSIREYRLKIIEKALCQAIPQLTKLSFNKNGNGIPHLETMFKHWKSGKHQENKFSDGMLRLIGLLWILLESHCLMLFEEPELSLNVSIIRELPSLMYRLQAEQNQIFISTHSYDLLSDEAINANEVLLLIPENNGTQIKLASSIPEINLLLEENMCIADAVLPYTNPNDMIQWSFIHNGNDTD